MKEANDREVVDVAVVGAGLAGLVAARSLLDKGLSVLVLGARERVGGRLLNHALDNGAVVELGGQWVEPTQDRVLAKCLPPRYRCVKGALHVTGIVRVVLGGLRALRRRSILHSVAGLVGRTRGDRSPTGSLNHHFSR